MILKKAHNSSIPISCYFVVLMYQQLFFSLPAHKRKYAMGFSTGITCAIV